MKVVLNPISAIKVGVNSLNEQTVHSTQSVVKLQTISGQTYGDSNVAAYLLLNPQQGLYSNSNVSSYLLENPQQGLYGDSNVESYLTQNPQPGTYTNSNVALYLTENPQQGLYNDSNVALYLPHYGGSVNVFQVTSNTNYMELGSIYGFQMQYDPTGTYDVYDIKNGSWLYFDSGGLVFNSNTDGLWDGTYNTNTVVIGNDGSIRAAANITGPNIITSNVLFADSTTQTTAWKGSLDNLVWVNSSFAFDTPFRSAVNLDVDGITLSTMFGIPPFGLTSNTWNFSYGGSLTFPDSTVQNTAFTGYAIDTNATSLAQSAYDEANSAYLLAANSVQSSPNTPVSITNIMNVSNTINMFGVSTRLNLYSGANIFGGSGNIYLTPNTAASPLAGVVIGGNGYILGPNGARNITLNYIVNNDIGIQSNAFIGITPLGGNLTVNNNVIISYGNLKIGNQYQNVAFTDAINTSITNAISNISTLNVYTTSAYNQANLANTIAQSSYDFANTVNSYAYNANTFLQANQATLWTFANSSYNKANNALANTGTLVTANGSTQYLFSNTSTSAINVAGGVLVGTSQANYLQITGAATNVNPQISVLGSDNNISMNLVSKGTGQIGLYTNSVKQFDVYGPVSVVNWIRASGGISGTSPYFEARGADNNIDFSISPKGTGNVNFLNSTSTLFKMVGPASGNNYLQTSSSVAGSPVSISAIGTDANIDLALAPKGSGSTTSSGRVKITHTPAVGVNAAIEIVAANTKGGAGYADFLAITNTSGGTTNPNKFVRVGPTGTFEIVNSAYNSTLFSMTDTGDLTLQGNTTSQGVAAGYAPNRPGFRVIGANTTNNLTTTQNGTGALNYNNWSLDFNQNGLNYTSGVFTAPAAGLYQVNVVGRNSGYAGGYSQIACVKNASGGTGSGGSIVTMLEWAASSTMNHVGSSSIIKLAVGDTLCLKVLAGQVNFDQNDNWSVAYIG